MEMIETQETEGSSLSQNAPSLIHFQRLLYFGLYKKRTSRRRFFFI